MDIENNIFYESAKEARKKQEIKDLKYKIVLLKDSLAKTLKAKLNVKYKKDGDVIDGSISNYKSQIDEFKERIEELTV